MKSETLITAVLVASVAVLVIYFGYVVVTSFNMDLFIKSLMY